MISVFESRMPDEDSMEDAEDDAHELLTNAHSSIVQELESMKSKTMSIEEFGRLYEWRRVSPHMNTEPHAAAARI